MAHCGNSSSSSSMHLVSEPTCHLPLCSKAAGLAEVVQCCV
jgi:hypothetical protein